MSRPNVGHPYGRVSSDPQRQGDGIRRQSEADHAGFCKLFRFHLSEIILFDEGVSAFDESNWDEDAALGRFLAKAAEGIEVRRGDCLIAEDWDRLARLPWTKLVKHLGNLFEAGIHLGDATRMRLIRCDSEDVADAIDLICGTSRGHGESKRKSQMTQALKDNRRKLAQQGKAIITRRLPAWVELVPCEKADPEARIFFVRKKERYGKLVLKEPAASTIRQVILLLKEGYGTYQAVKEMQKRGVCCPFGQRWIPKQVNKLLHDRRLTGELPPVSDGEGRRKKSNKEQDKAIAGYYPELLTEEEFFALAGLRRGKRKLHRGRDAELPNPFRGLIKDAISGGTYHYIPVRGRHGEYKPKLQNHDGQTGQGTMRSLDYKAFEDVVLSRLLEIKPSDVLGEQGEDNDLLSLTGRMVDCEMRRDGFKESTKGKTMTPLLVEMAIALDAEYEDIKQRLAEAKVRASRPLQYAWSEQQSLIAAYRSASDPVAVRLRLRRRLQETIRQIWLLVVKKGQGRDAIIQIDFISEPITRRHYMFTFYPGIKTPHYSREARWEPVASWRSDEAWAGIDLASRADARLLAGWLESGEDVDSHIASCSARHN